MLGIYNYTVVLTYLGMLVSFFGLTLALRGEAQVALVCLMFSGICDMFDGKIAATKTERTAQEMRFGIQIDSLSDLICFGALPAVIVCTISGECGISCFAGGIYLLSALIRLAWFNVDEEERQTYTRGPREFYQGLPVTSSALVLPAVMGLAYLCAWPVDKLGSATLLVMAAGFLTPFSLKKPGFSGQMGLLACGGVLVLLVSLATMGL